MLAVIKKLDSGVIKGLITAAIPLLVLLASLFGLDEAVFKAKLEGWGEAIVQLVALGGVFWATVARLFQPTPPLTETAAQKTADKIADGTLKTVTTTPVNRQGGYVQPVLLALIVGLVAFVACAIVGCTGTKNAYKAAETLPEEAFVVTEHYAALVKEAADLVALPGTPESVRTSLKRAGAASKPWIVGDDTATPRVPSLKELADAYQATHDAEQAADLQAALNRAVVALSDFIKAVKAARSTRDTQSNNTSPRGSEGSCFGARTSGPDQVGGYAVCFG